MNALQRSELAEKQQLINLLSQDARTLGYAARHALPPNPAKWPLEVLRKAAAAVSGSTVVHSPQQESEEMSTATVAAALTFYVAFTPEALKSVTYNKPKREKGVKVLAVTQPADLEALPTERQLEIVNKTRKNAISKFSTPEIAQEHTFKALERVVEDSAPAPKKGSRSPLFERPVGEVKPVRRGTKAAILIELLDRKEGVSMAEACEALSQSGKPVKDARGWMTYDVAQLRGYGITSKMVGDEARYFLVKPAGMEKPLIEDAAPKAEPKAPAAKKTAKKGKSARAE